MGDPLSGTASALAVITFAGSVLKKCIDFCNDFKDAPAQLIRLQTRFQCLDGLVSSYKTALETLKTRSENTTDIDGIYEMERLFELAESSLVSLEPKIQKLNQLVPEPEDHRQTVRTVKARFEYVLRKTSLAELAAVTSTIQEDLTSVMHKLFFESLQSSVTAVEQNMLKKEQYDRSAISKWMNSFSSARLVHSETAKSRTKGTGLWIFDVPEWDCWQKGSNSLLWLHGGSGSGKSVLCSSIIDQLKQYSTGSSTILYAYHYFSFSRLDEQKLDRCLISLIEQLCHLNKSIPTDLYEAWETSQPSLPTVDTMTSILKNLISNTSKTFLVFDALDECQDTSVREDFLNWLIKFRENSMQQLSILITSRNHPDIEQVLVNIMAGQEISPDKDCVQNDISKYIDIEMSQSLKLASRIQRKPQLATQIRDGLCSRAAGMFRWVHCQLESIKNLPTITPADIEDVFSDLPQDLNAHYERTLSKIHERYQSRVRNALVWLATSRRPLFLEELAEACVVDLNSFSPIVVDSDRQFNPEDLHTLIPDFISTEEVNSRVVVRLAHFSVHEYLSRLPPPGSPATYFCIDRLQAEISLCKSCLRYITYGSPTWQKSPLNRPDKNLPLMRYACKFWYIHLFWCTHHYNGRKNSKNGEILLELSGTRSLVLDLFATSSKFRCWLKVHNPDGDVSWDNFGSPLYFAAYLDLRFCFNYFLEKDSAASVNLCGGRYGTALQAAAAAGNRNIFYKLLEFGANPNIQNGEHGNVLGACAASGLQDCVTYLLESKRADASASNSAALHEACAAGHVSIVQQLIRNGASVSEQWGANTPLIRAVDEHQDSVIEILLENGADINQLLHSWVDDAGKQHWVHFATALERASMDPYIITLKLLIDRGADVNLIGGLFGSALCVAAIFNSPKALQILIANNADPNLGSCSQDCPLHQAIVYGSLDCALCLLQAGARLVDMNEEEMTVAIAKAGGPVAWIREQNRVLKR